MSVIRRLTNVAKGKVKQWQRGWRDGPGEEPDVEEPPLPKKAPVEEEPPKAEEPVKEPERTPRKRRL
jgi:hypothetical protein